MTPTTSAALPPPPARRITEVKEPLEGVAQEFDLECWLRSDNQAVGRWPAVEGNAFGLLAGGWSWGVWGTQRPYGAYRMHDPGGTLQGYRIDAVSDVRISDAEVRYRDLLLDARITPGGEVTLEDEDEAERAVRKRNSRCGSSGRWPGCAACWNRDRRCWCTRSTRPSPGRSRRWRGARPSGRWATLPAPRRVPQSAAATPTG